MDSNWFIVVATFLGPVFAVYAAGRVERNRRRRDEKLALYKTLMATRAIQLSPQHAEALNVIDVVFGSGPKGDRAVRDAWKAYLDHLNHVPPHYSDAWAAKQVDLLVDLLHAMGTTLGFDYDRTHIKNQAYWPKFLGNIDNQFSVIRGALVDVLTNNRPVTVHLDNPSGDIA